MVYIIKNTKWHSQTGGNIDFGFSSRKKYPLSFIQELPQLIRKNGDQIPALEIWCT